MFSPLHHKEKNLAQNKGIRPYLCVHGREYVLVFLAKLAQNKGICPCFGQRSVSGCTVIHHNYVLIFGMLLAEIILRQLAQNKGICPYFGPYVVLIFGRLLKNLGLEATQVCPS